MLPALFHLGIAPPVTDTAIQAPASSQLHLPVLNVGLPQSGSASIIDFFECGGMKTSHYQCKADCTGDRADLDSCKKSSLKSFCGPCVVDNIRAGSPPLNGCGDYVIHPNCLNPHNSQQIYPTDVWNPTAHRTSGRNLTGHGQHLCWGKTAFCRRSDPWTRFMKHTRMRRFCCRLSRPRSGSKKSQLETRPNSV